MTRLIAVMTTRAGGTSTHWATCVAWTLAQRVPVTLVDADMEGGTLSDLLGVDPGTRSLGNLLGSTTVTPEQLLAQAVATPRQPRLRLVPGLRRSYGPEMPELLRTLGPGLRKLPDPVTIVDLGHPLAHPGLGSPRRAAEAIAAAFERIFIVIRGEPVLLARSLDVLTAAAPPQGEVILCHSGSRSMVSAVREVLEEHVPGVVLRGTWDWDERKAARMRETGVPLTLPGVDAGLHLIPEEPATQVETPVAAAR